MPTGDAMTPFERYQAQFDRCFRPLPKKPAQVVKPLTGIEKHFLEADEAREMWEELEREP